MADNYLETAMDRIVLMQKAAITRADGTAPDAFPHPFVKSDAFPYWLNIVGAMQSDLQSVESERRDHTIVMRLMLGHITQDYTGAIPDRLNGYIVDVLNYFNARPTLRRDSSDSQIKWLAPAPMGAFIDRMTGIKVEEGGSRVWCDFTLVVPFVVRLDRVY